jgi:hypothetical protein
VADTSQPPLLSSLAEGSTFQPHLKNPNILHPIVGHPGKYVRTTKTMMWNGVEGGSELVVIIASYTLERAAAVAVTVAVISIDKQD